MLLKKKEIMKKTLIEVPLYLRQAHRIPITIKQIATEEDINKVIKDTINLLRETGNVI